MTQTERDFRRLASFHGDMVSDGEWLSLDLTRRPALGRHGEEWADYITLLLDLMRRAAMGRGGLRLECNRFLKLRIPGGR